MENLLASQKAEVEILVRQTAIRVSAYGVEAIELFCKQFPEIARSIAINDKKEQANRLERYLEA